MFRFLLAGFLILGYAMLWIIGLPFHLLRWLYSTPAGIHYIVVEIR